MRTKFLAVILASLLIISLCVEVIIAKDDKENKDKLERIDIKHYAKPKNQEKTKPETCYKLFGIKWISLPADYIINPSNPNPQDLSEDFIISAISASAETWDDATISELFNDDYEVNYNMWYGVQDYKNVISFGDYPQENVIAVTSYWRSMRTKEIVEFDIMLDTDWVWGDATEGWAIDLQNIATHELGHGIGLDDIYSTTCSEVTMYGYSNYWEMSKRDLAPADIMGIQKLYG